TSKWDAVTGKQLGSPATGGLISPEAQAVWTDLNAANIGIGKPNSKQPSPLPSVKRPSGLILFSPDGKILAVCDGRETRRGARDKIPESKIALYEVPTGKLLHTSAIDNARLGEYQRGLMFFTPDSKLLGAFADAKTLGVWDTASGQRIAALIPAVTMGSCSGAFSPDGRCV